MDDRELLRAYVQSQSQEAFRDLVDRHLPMVFSAARRLIGDAHLAEEVAQSVFGAFAQKADTLGRSTVVGGWLYNTTRNLAMHAVRSEARRRQREQEAAAMQSQQANEPAWPILNQLEPAMAELSESERDALVLRYFEDRSLREVGQELGIGEDAARMRVNRALERLRTIFARQGTAVSAVMLASALAASTTSAVPAGLAAGITATALAATTVAAKAVTHAVFTTMFKIKAVAALLGVAVLTGTGTYLVRQRQLERVRTDIQQLAPPQPAVADEMVPVPAPVEPVAAPPSKAPVAKTSVAPQPAPATVPAPLTKAERLAQLREQFRGLAGGDPTTALRTARQLTDETERETALLALLTEWKHGELSPPRHRAWAIASFGLEAGLGFELAGNPELAMLWGTELAYDKTHAVRPERLGAAMVDADPAAAIAFSGQLSVGDRRKFLHSAFASWAAKDTEAAMQWAEQMSEPAEREVAINAIRSVAPTGIGVMLETKAGYPVIAKLMPGTPAALGMQLHPGDRIVGVAQGDYAFVDARNLGVQELVQAIRGAPGSLVQLQVLPADAPPESAPKTVTVVREQLKLKQ